MNIDEQNVPQAYRDWLKNAAEKSNYFYSYARRKKPALPKRTYTLDGLYSLTRDTDYRGKPQQPRYLAFTHKDAFWRELSGANVDKLPPIEALRTAFPFGCCDGGTLFFHPENHSIWLVYGEMYTELVADSFEEFMEKAVFDKRWDFD